MESTQRIFCILNTSRYIRVSRQIHTHVVDICDETVKELYLLRLINFKSNSLFGQNPAKNDIKYC